MNKNAFSHIDVPDRGWHNSDGGADGWGYGVVEHGSDGGEFSAGAFGDSKHINNVFDEGEQERESKVEFLHFLNHWSGLVFSE